MISKPIKLENEFWQVCILPATGASIAYGRVNRDGEWVDVLRPTAEADYHNASKASSFIMLPWCNRIKGGRLVFEGQEYQLETAKDDGTARHGVVRGVSWQVDMPVEPTRLRMRFDATWKHVNWPFPFSAWAEYRLEGRDFIWTLALKNLDTARMPGGFGHHPYFARSPGEAEPQVQIPCNQQFNLVDYMAVDAPVPVTPRLDFRQMRPLDNSVYNDLLTGREGDKPARISFPSRGISLSMHSDPIFEHILLFTPEGQPFFAVEPMTNASDGFNLYARGIPGSGVFALEPGEERQGTVRLQLE
jgi:aldose 1-epimerase